MPKKPISPTKPFTSACISAETWHRLKPFGSAEGVLRAGLDCLEAFKESPRDTPLEDALSGDTDLNRALTNLKWYAHLGIPRKKRS